MYNHPLGFNLYNINNSKRHIQEFGRCFLFESEKSCLKYASYFGLNNDISVAVCGNSINNYQISLLLSLGCKELVIGLDKQYEEIGNENWTRWTHKYYQIANKYAKYLQISFLFDLQDNLLDFKDSPIDKGKDVFFELYKNRIRLGS